MKQKLLTNKDCACGLNLLGAKRGAGMEIKMMTLVSYDVSTVDPMGKTRLRKISKECQNYGQRVQNSVFEIDVDYGTFLKLKDRLIKLIDETQDSLRIYYLGNNWKRKVEHHGAKESYNPEGALII
jgi:CRISPR-associated protein Cas2